jgi:chromosome segregation ATPase
MATVTEKIEELEGRIDELKSNADRFDLENWRDVVPDVRADVEELADGLDELKAAAFELEQDLIRAEDPDDYEPPGDPRY